METKTYYYSRYLIYFMTTAFSGIEFLLIYFDLQLIFEKNTVGAITFSIVLILNAAALTWYIRKYFTAAIQNKPTIELDEEKLQYFVGDWEIDWKDIAEITSSYMGVKVVLKDGEEMFINLKWINAESDPLTDTMNEYLDNVN